MNEERSPSDTVSDISFRGSDPGAVKYGNFINYYQFHPPEKRIQTLPTEIWSNMQDENCHVLDIGCNAGNLTQSIYSFLNKQAPKTNYKLYGIDIDPLLVERAILHNDFKSNVFYNCLNIMNEKDRLSIFNFLPSNKVKYNYVFCFSVLMWIHLNNGDEGLIDCLKYLCNMTDVLIIELQPWKCYKNAVRRMQKSNDDFALYKSLKIRNNVEDEIVRLIQEQGFIKIFESFSKEWNRKIIIFKAK
ncbi:probable RNA methyltransferase CG11342 [Ctenocephalides felis]|uniref:probable RNA methyltransferase CG11342 n=1 Tax=Ctenocephalides felis TaxID=7515 RepID=UPI000E6E40F7|nr:probable RNA methyltransferase CG11342 [Ctenocephalides felis]